MYTNRQLCCLLCNSASCIISYIEKVFGFVNLSHSSHFSLRVHACVQFLWIIFNSLQSASRGHSQHSVQTDSTHTHTHTHTHTLPHTRTHTGDSCPLQSKGEVAQARAQEAAGEKESAWKRRRDVRGKEEGEIQKKRKRRKRERRVHRNEREWWACRERGSDSADDDASDFVCSCLFRSTQLDSQSQFLTEAEREIGEKLELTLIQSSLWGVNRGV